MDRDARGAVARHHGVLREESGRAEGAGARGAGSGAGVARGGSHVMLSNWTGASTPYTPSDLTTRRRSKKSLDTEQSCGGGGGVRAHQERTREHSNHQSLRPFTSKTAKRSNTSISCQMKRVPNNGGARASDRTGVKPRASSCPRLFPRLLRSRARRRTARRLSAAPRLFGLCGGPRASAEIAAHSTLSARFCQPATIVSPCFVTSVCRSLSSLTASFISSMAWSQRAPAF